MTRISRVLLHRYLIFYFVSMISGKQLARTLRNELADMFEQSGLDLAAAFKAFDADGDGVTFFQSASTRS